MNTKRDIKSYNSYEVLLAATHCFPDIPFVGDWALSFSTHKGHTNARLTGSGWSPSLHHAKITMTTEISHHPDIALRDFAEILAKNFNPLFEEQSARYESALALGSKCFLKTNQIAHLETDVAFAPVLTARGGDPSETLVTMLRQAHSFSSVYNLKTNSKNTGVLLKEIDEGNGVFRRILVPHVKLTEKRTAGAWVAWRAHKLQIRKLRLPQAAITALTGKPLGEVVQVHPLLDERIIRSAEQTAMNVIELGIDLITKPIPDVVPGYDEADFQRGKFT